MYKQSIILFAVFLSSLMASVQIVNAQYSIPPKLEWWYEARFGMFIHFGSYSYLGEGENAVYVDDWVFDRFQEYQSEISAKFNPVNFNAGTIADLAKKAGMKYLVITAKHCEGFSMWKTEVESFTDLTGTKLYSLPDFTDFGSRDILMELKDSCEARDIKFGLYYSFLDWNHKSQIPHDDWFTNMVSFEAREEFITDMKSQLKELITNYQPAVLWFDGDWTYNNGEPTLSKWWTTTDARELYTFLMDLDSTLIVNERIIRGFDLGDFNTAERTIPDKPLSRQWEACRNMNGSWGYNSKKMNNYKSSAEFIRELVKTVSRDGNYLLNIGPKGDGTVPDQEINILQDIGEWMSIYGESIYGTTRSPYSSEPFWGYYTKKPGKTYLHLFSWPSNGEITVPPSSETVKKIYPLNDRSNLLDFTYSNDDIIISLPENRPNPVNSVIVMDFTGAPVSSVKKDRIDENISLFPNLVDDDILNIKQSGNSIFDITIYNIYGQELLIRKMNGKFLEINVSALLPDLYFVKVSDGESATIRKFIKN